MNLHRKCAPKSNTHSCMQAAALTWTQVTAAHPLSVFPSLSSSFPSLCPAQKCRGTSFCLPRLPRQGQVSNFIIFQWLTKKKIQPLIQDRFSPRSVLGGGGCRKRNKLFTCSMQHTLSDKKTLCTFIATELLLQNLLSRRAQKEFIPSYLMTANKNIPLTLIPEQNTAQEWHLVCFTKA